jgi:hypothetical protein
MIWLAERIAALVVIIIGSQILFHLFRDWWHSQAWLRATVVFVLNGAWHILTALALFFALLNDRMDCLTLGLAKTAHGPIAVGRRERKKRAKKAS